MEITLNKKTDRNGKQTGRTAVNSTAAEFCSTNSSTKSSSTMHNTNSNTNTNSSTIQ